MAHDSYHCENERLKNASAIKVFPFPIQRDGKYIVGGSGPNQGKVDPPDCPMACRPTDHQDWIKC